MLSTTTSPLRISGPTPMVSTSPPASTRRVSIGTGAREGPEDDEEAPAAAGAGPDEAGSGDEEGEGAEHPQRSSPAASAASNRLIIRPPRKRLDTRHHSGVRRPHADLGYSPVDNYRQARRTLEPPDSRPPNSRTAG
ncbi:hypothetical protein Aco04nite_86940 [Winogradskya consettensis]|uniref:Uncharacterized protein n=1 Tax=Winogradskya consettensis TaxID=113560 RepID=A0A919W6I0_9ACTN|nr:hypothetical protein Aco04nite_86940 [Actinoplanes consettensis]